MYFFFPFLPNCNLLRSSSKSYKFPSLRLYCSTGSARFYQTEANPVFHSLHPAPLCKNALQGKALQGIF
jgi:hypothetical protein